MSQLKLESLVGFLSGKQHDASLDQDLTDPASEASLFLEAARERSRQLVGPLVIPPATAPASPSQPRLIWAFLSVAVIASLILALLEWRIERLESSNAQRSREAREFNQALNESIKALQRSQAESTQKLSELIKPPEGSPNVSGLMEKLTALERGIESSQNQAGLDKLRADFSSLRTQVESIEKQSSIRAEESQTAFRETQRLIKLIMSRLDPPAPANPDSSRSFPGTPRNGTNPRTNP